MKINKNQLFQHRKRWGGVIDVVRRLLWMGKNVGATGTLGKLGCEGLRRHDLRQCAQKVNGGQFYKKKPFKRNF